MLAFDGQIEIMILIFCEPAEAEVEVISVSSRTSTSTLYPKLRVRSYAEISALVGRE
jgi:hypothetical protein